MEIDIESLERGQRVLNSLILELEFMLDYPDEVTCEDLRYQASFIANKWEEYFGEKLRNEIEKEVKC